VTSGNSATIAIDVALRNSVGSYVNAATVGASGSVSQPNLGLGGEGSPYPCAQPVDLGVYTSSSQGANYNLTVTRFARERFNTGSADLATATPLSADAGMTCDQVCGYEHSEGFVCADSVQYQAFTLPPRTSADVMLHLFTYSGACDVRANCAAGLVQLYMQGGQYVCDVMSNGIRPTMPADALSRISNNSDQPQTVVLAITNLYIEMGYSIVVATEH
jgi:hypothetical protein